MTQKRSTGTVVSLIVGLLLIMGGCGGESSQTGGTGQVVLEATAAVFTATPLPGQSATLDIVGVRTGIPMTVNPDGSVSATVSEVPVGTWTFRITYRAGSGSVKYVIAETSMVETVTANTTTRVKLPPPTKLSAPATAIAAGSDHSCALLADAAVSCWGDNSSGQLGNETTTQSSSPVAVTGLSATAIAAGAAHNCALLADAAVSCWGDNRSGQLGNGTKDDSSSPVVVLTSNRLPLTGVTAVAAGNNYSCAILNGGSTPPTGTVWCWGATTTTAVRVPNLSGVTAIAVGGFGSPTAPININRGCAVLNGGSTPPPTGTVWCWEATTTTPKQITNLSGVTAVDAGTAQSCAVLNGGSNLPTGTVWCWEANTTTAVQVPNLSGVTAVAVGNDAQQLLYSCAHLGSGTVWCWGDNSVGQLGNGTDTSSSSPVAVLTSNGRALTGVIAIAAGSAHSCAVLDDGAVSCWGDNSAGQLGNGTDTSSSSPVAVLTSSGSVLTSVTTVAAGSRHTCAILTGETVSCWGVNNPTAVQVPNLNGVTAVAAGSGHSCAVLDGDSSTGTVWCWRANTTIAERVTNLSGATNVAAGSTHDCAVLNGRSSPPTGTVWCWGANTTTAVQVTNLSGVTAVAVGNGFAPGGARSCAVLDGDSSTGTVWCWGANNPTAEQVNLSGATDVAAGNDHSCARLGSGTVWCWGDNSAGQLGNGTDTSSSSPVAVFNLTTAVAVVAGNGHSCARLSSFTVRCWGNNSSGQLGDGTNDESSIPVPVLNLTTATAVAAGSDHSCARLGSGTVSCWGSNSFGQLGNGAPRVSPLAVKVVGIP